MDSGIIKDDSVMWNPYNKVVQSHRSGKLYANLTNLERSKRNLPVPWAPTLNEAGDPPIY